MRPAPEPNWSLSDMRRLTSLRTFTTLATTCAAVLALTCATAGAAPDRGSDLKPAANPPGALVAVDALTNKNVWATGYQQPAPGTAAPLAEHWDGVSWQRTETPTPDGQPYGILEGVSAISNDDVWAVGFASAVSGGASTTLAEHWDGTAWTIVPTAQPPGSTWSALQSVTAVAPDDVWAVGYYYDSGDGGSVIEHWDGSAWSIVANADPGDSYHAGLQSISAHNAGDVWAVGYYYDSIGAGNTLTEHWNGTAWKLVDSPNEPDSPDTELHAVTGFRKHNVWATGFAFTGSSYAPVALHWDGTSWRLMHAAVPEGSQSTYLYGVAGTRAKAMWATGYYLEGGNYHTLAERWHGKTWHVATTPDGGQGSNYLFGIDALSRKNLWAAGFVFTDQDVPFAEHHTGSGWALVPAE
jgi:hypothetical protein